MAPPQVAPLAITYHKNIFLCACALQYTAVNPNSPDISVTLGVRFPSAILGASWSDIRSRGTVKLTNFSSIGQRAVARDARTNAWDLLRDARLMLDATRNVCPSAITLNCRIQSIYRVNCKKCGKIEKGFGTGRCTAQHRVFIFVYLQCGQQLASQAILIFKAFLPILYKNEVWCQQCEYSCQQKQLWTKKQDNPD